MKEEPSILSNSDITNLKCLRNKIKSKKDLKRFRQNKYKILWTHVIEI